MKKLTALLLALAVALPSLAANSQARSRPNVDTVQVASATPQADQGNPNVRVWVNTASGIYHCPGTRWYGKTQHGEYMTQAEAQKKGNRPAYGRVCR